MRKIIRPEMPINNDFQRRPKKRTQKGKNYIFVNTTEYMKAQSQ